MQICLDIYFLNYIFLCFCIESSACPGDYSDKYLSNRLFLYLNICSMAIYNLPNRFDSDVRSRPFGGLFFIFRLL